MVTEFSALYSLNFSWFQRIGLGWLAVVEKEKRKSNCIKLQRLEEDTVKTKKQQKGRVFVTLKNQKVIARSDITGFYYPGMYFCPYFKYLLVKHYLFGYLVLFL